MRVADLIGAQLDLWVARAEGKCATVNPSVWGNAIINEVGRLSISKGSWDCAKYFEPSSNWAHGGPIIERESIAIQHQEYSDGSFREWVACSSRDFDSSNGYTGPTPLVAAMRAYVAAKFGDQVPD